MSAARMSNPYTLYQYEMIEKLYNLDWCHCESNMHDVFVCIPSYDIWTIISQTKYQSQGHGTPYVMITMTITNVSFKHLKFTTVTYYNVLQ